MMSTSMPESRCTQHKLWREISGALDFLEHSGFATKVASIP
jgi:hypothetical protein